ncbi:MAG: hypothetical protein HZC52_00990, partial [Planctomycetes bacterium]|nr:hypothetical protein [Planctomycetota bacterium]
MAEHISHLFIISIILYLAGSLFALCFYGWQRVGNYISLILAAIASCFSIAAAAVALSSGSTIRLDFTIYHAIIKYSFLLDPVSAYFILAI